MRNKAEYIICRQIATYLRYQYPDVLFKFDQSGLNLSKAQAGMNKAIQMGKGWPDLLIAEPRNKYHSLFIEVKHDAVNINLKNKHILEQRTVLDLLRSKGYFAEFACGFDAARLIIDNYLKA